MGKVNVWLKRSYIILTVLIGTISALLLAFTLFSHGYMHEDEEIERVLGSLQIMYGISIGTMALAIIGVFGACKEKKWALIVFAVGMILGSLFMLLLEILALIARPMIAADGKHHYLDLLPLSNASENSVTHLNQIEMNFECCGLDQGYLDWGYDIPESCVCNEESKHPCVAAPRNSSLFKQRSSDMPIMIYEEPCLQYITAHIYFVINNMIGIMLGITLLLILSVVTCVLILCQLNRKLTTPTMVYSQEATAGNYAILTEAAELT
ncbi:hypothetical protein Q5P01_003538 [Channa striata]|uniref:Tetraspanin n=1 Tax=Channa striata TaxID=64152 RepID=A0AA88NG59_CHASR|nr:hypothetical protein Q5P01_003538 [Channa striata]